MKYIVTFGGFVIYEGADPDTAYDTYRAAGPYGKIWEVDE